MDLLVRRHIAFSVIIRIKDIIAHGIQLFPGEALVIHRYTDGIVHLVFECSVASDHPLSHGGQSSDMGILLFGQRDVPLLEAVERHHIIMQSIDHGSFVPELRLFYIRIIGAPVLQHLFRSDRHYLVKQSLTPAPYFFSYLRVHIPAFLISGKDSQQLVVCQSCLRRSFLLAKRDLTENIDVTIVSVDLSYPGTPCTLRCGLLCSSEPVQAPVPQLMVSPALGLQLIEVCELRIEHIQRHADIGHLLYVLFDLVYLVRALLLQLYHIKAVRIVGGSFHHILPQFFDLLPGIHYVIADHCLFQEVTHSLEVYNIEHVLLILGLQELCGPLLYRSDLSGHEIDEIPVVVGMA